MSHFVNVPWPNWPNEVRAELALKAEHLWHEGHDGSPLYLKVIYNGRTEGYSTVVVSQRFWDDLPLSQKTEYTSLTSPPAHPGHQWPHDEE